MRYVKTLPVIISSVVAMSSLASAYEITQYGGREVRWLPDDLPAIYEINSYGSIDCEGTAEAIEISADTWIDVNGSFFEFVRGADTDIMNYGHDGHSILVFYHPEYNQYGQGGLPYPDQNYVGVNTFWFRTDGPHYNEIFEFDIIFNGYDFDWDTSADGTEGCFDVQNIATHELGHSLSLADLYTSNESNFTMYGYTEPAEIKKRTLEYDDEDGLIYLYSDGTVDPVRPHSFILRPSYPNPASTGTTFVFTVPTGQQGFASVKVYDLKGRVLDEPFRGSVIPDVYEVDWDLTARGGSKVAPGVYIYAVDLNGEVQTGKFVVSY